MSSNSSDPTPREEALAAKNAELRAKLAKLEVEFRYIVGEIVMLSRAFEEFAGKRIDVNSLRSRTEKAMLETSDANLTPTAEDLKEAVDKAFAMTDPHNPRSGNTRAGGTRVVPKK